MGAWDSVPTAVLLMVLNRSAGTVSCPLLSPCLSVVVRPQLPITLSRASSTLASPCPLPLETRTLMPATPHPQEFPTQSPLVPLTAATLGLPSPTTVAVWTSLLQE